jgi:pimeloyl-ACP methyl ester carboxylesterase
LAVAGGGARQTPPDPVVKRSVGLGAVAAVAAAVVGAEVARRRRRLDDDDLEERLGTGQAFKVEAGDGAVLDGVVIGDGPTVVLSHCWTGTRDVWAPVASRLLAAGLRVVLYDQRGHGTSTLGDTPPTVAQLGDDLRSVLEAVDAHDAVVAGHSMGGMAAQALAVGHPDVTAQRVRALVLVSTAGHLTSLLYLGNVAGVVVGNERLGRLLAGRIGSAFVRPTAGRVISRRHLATTRDGFANTAAPVRLAYLKAMQSMDLRDGLRTVSVPTTVVVGSRDILTPPHLGRAIAAAIPGARLVEVPGAGHMLPFEAPDLLADLIAGAPGGQGDAGSSRGSEPTAAGVGGADADSAPA